MPLPDYERVLFRKHPLRLVIGQVRFPLVPGFGESSVIASFYEAIRSEYPGRSREHQMAFQISPKGMAQSPGEILWRFTTRDKFWAVVIGENAVTLEARGYTSIADLLQRFERVLEVTRDRLEVTDRARLGLRYINELRNPEAVTLDQWAELVRPEFVGFAASGVLEGRIEHMIQELRIEQPDGTLAMRHGLLTGTTVEPLTHEPPVGGRFYLIDLDYYDPNECELDIQGTMEQMRTYNDVLYRFFRWTLSDRLMAQLEPTDAA